MKEYGNDNDLDDSIVVKESQEAIRKRNDLLKGIGKEIYDEVMEIRKQKEKEHD